MPRNIEFHFEAEEELAEADIWYESQLLGLGDRFLHEVEAMCAHLQLYPQSFASEADGLRKAKIARFPYYLIYWLSEETIHVVAVAHTSRLPDYWKPRLESE